LRGRGFVRADTKVYFSLLRELQRSFSLIFVHAPHPFSTRSAKNKLKTRQAIQKLLSNVSGFIKYTMNDVMDNI